MSSETIQHKQQEHEGIKFQETVFPEWTPGTNRGMVCWELERNLPALSWSYDPKSPTTLEEARAKMREVVSRYIREHALSQVARRPTATPLNLSELEESA